jgi:hypothetical protein
LVSSEGEEIMKKEFDPYDEDFQFPDRAFKELTDGPFPSKSSTVISNRLYRRCRCRGDSDQQCFACQARMDEPDEPDVEYSEDGRERFLESNDD